ncbi:UNVERIFIED_CONTAM: hypothetical protein GTU68_028708 [Idotea baltica]|nr:hypothetical protein [Idotea baltica]
MTRLFVLASKAEAVRASRTPLALMTSSASSTRSTASKM